MEKCISRIFKRVCSVWSVVLIVAAILPMMQSCDLDDDDNGVVICPGKVPNAVVTVKTAADNTVYLQLDDKHL